MHKNMTVVQESILAVQSVPELIDERKGTTAGGYSRLYFRKIALFFIISICALYTGSAIAQGGKCEKGTQTFEGVCLHTGMIEYIKCLNNSGNGRVHIVKESQSANPSKVKVKVSATGGAKLIGGSVIFDRLSDKKSIKKIDETYSPNALTACFQLVSRTDGKTHTREKPPIDKKKVQSSLRREFAGAAALEIAIATWADVHPNCEYQDGKLVVDVNIPEGRGDGYAGCCLQLPRPTDISMHEKAAKIEVWVERSAQRLEVKLEAGPSGAGRSEVHLFDGRVQPGRHEYRLSSASPPQSRKKVLKEVRRICVALSGESPLLNRINVSP